jgi:hypothetical protein
LSVDVVQHALSAVVVVLDLFEPDPVGTRSTLRPCAEARSQIRRSRRDPRIEDQHK